VPRVQIRKSVASAEYVYQEGETVEVTGERATELVSRGYGELVRGEAPETPETAAVRRPETPEGPRQPSPAVGSRERRVSRRGGA
jgi:hypothetical protein